MLAVCTLYDVFFLLDMPDLADLIGFLGLVLLIPLCFVVYQFETIHDGLLTERRETEERSAARERTLRDKRRRLSGSASLVAANQAYRDDQGHKNKVLITTNSDNDSNLMKDNVLTFDSDQCRPETTSGDEDTGASPKIQSLVPLQDR